MEQSMSRKRLHQSGDSLNESAIIEQQPLTTLIQSKPMPKRRRYSLGGTSTKGISYDQGQSGKKDNNVSEPEILESQRIFNPQQDNVRSSEDSMEEPQGMPVLPSLPTSKTVGTESHKRARQSPDSLNESAGLDSSDKPSSSSMPKRARHSLGELSVSGTSFNEENIERDHSSQSCEQEELDFYRKVNQEQNVKDSDKGPLGKPVFHSTPMPKRSASFDELSTGGSSFNRENIEKEDDDFDFSALEEELEFKKMFNQQREESGTEYREDEPESFEECSWLHQRNFRHEQLMEYVENKGKKMVRFAPELTPYVVRRSPNTVQSPASAPDILTTEPARQDEVEFLSITPRVSRLSTPRFSRSCSTPGATNPVLTPGVIGSTPSPSQRLAKPSPLHSGAQTVNDSHVDLEQHSLPLLLEEPSLLNSLPRRHVPMEAEKTFDISAGTVMPAFSPQTVAWNKRLNLLVFQWETGIAMWSPVRDDMRLANLTTDIGYECRIARMAWNQGFTTLAMVSCRGDLMLWNCLNNRKIRAKPLPEAAGATIKLLAWKAFVPEKEDMETLYIMTKQGMLFEFRVFSLRVEPIRCLKTTLKDPLHLTISPNSKHIACSNSKGTLGLWKVALPEEKKMEDFTYRKKLGELHSWCPWLSKTLAVASSTEKNIKVYDLAESKVTFTVGTFSAVTHLAWSEDCRELVTAQDVYFTCWKFPKMEKVMTIKVDRPTLCLDVREDLDSCLLTLNNRGLISLWRCFDREDNGCRFLNEKVQLRKQTTKAVSQDDSFLDLLVNLLR